MYYSFYQAKAEAIKCGGVVVEWKQGTYQVLQRPLKYDREETVVFDSKREEKNDESI